MDNAFDKAASAILDYQWDWSLWLAPGETITTATFSVPSGLTLTSQSNTTTTATAWLSGGSAGQTYPVVNQIATNQGRTDSRVINIYVKVR